MQQYIQSPINCSDNKFHKLDKLIPLLNTQDKFFDLCCGGANVGININAKQLILNDNNPYIIGLLNLFYTHNVNNIINTVDEIINKYKLSQSNIYTVEHYTDTNSLAEYNKLPYIALRGDFNAMEQTNELYFYYLLTLTIFSFNHQMRFNTNNHFNTAIGKKDFNVKYRQKIIDFCNKLHSLNVIITSKDYTYFEEILNNKSLLYMDIPYVNINNDISLQKQLQVFQFLDDMSFKGINFALSNYMTYKGIINHDLMKWASKYKINEINFIESNDGIQPTQEVLITNY